MHTTPLLAALLIVFAGCGEQTAPNQYVPSPAPGGAAVAPVVQSASGRVSHNDRTMSIRGSFATWYPGRKSLDIALLPFEPSAKEMRSLAGESFFFLDDAKNPDPSLFKRCPYAILRLQWREVKRTPPQLVAADAVTFEFHGLDPKQTSTTLRPPLSDFLRRQLAECSLTLTGDRGHVVIEFQGDNETWGKHVWAISVRAPVFVR